MTEPYPYEEAGNDWGWVGKEGNWLSIPAPTGPDPRTDANGCPDQPHHGVDCPGDACRYAADDPRTDAAVGR